MASSGIINCTTNNENWGGRITWSASSNTSTLKTTVTYNLQVIAMMDGSAMATAFYGWSYVKNSSTGAVIVERNIGGGSGGGGVVKTIPTSTWVTVETVSFTVTHNSATGEPPSIFLEAAWDSGNGVSYYSPKKAAISLNRMNRNAYVSSAPNFTDEENPTMNYVVPSISGTTKLQACISFDGSKDDIPYRDIDKNAKSYTFELTDAERAILRNATLNGSNTRTVYFYVRSTVGGYTSTHRQAKTLTIVNAEPELSVFLLDTNQKTVALTGDSLATLIKGYSNVAYEMGATFKKGAALASYSAINGGSALTSDTGVFESVSSNEFSFTVTDNRGLTAKKDFKLNILDYFRPTVSQEVTIEMNGETTAKVKLEVSGEWCSKHYGAAHNALRVEYRYKVGSGEYGAWVGTDYITDNNSYKVTFTIDDLDYTQAHTFQSRAVDSLDSAITAEYPIRLIPVFDWGENDFNFNVPVNFAKGFSIGGDNIIADYPVETGVEPMGSNGLWYWTKWASGKAECYGVRNYGNMAIDESWGSLYTSADFTQELPYIFNSAPAVHIEPHGTESGFVFIMKQGMPTESNTGTFIVCRPGNMTVRQVYISFQAVGRWK